MYKSITNGESLIALGAHNSMVDACAQSDLLLHPFSVSYLYCTDSFCSVDNIFGKNQLSELKRGLEPSRPVHSPWTEQTAENNVQWQPTERDSYTGASGGSMLGSTSVMSRVTRTASNLAAVFFFMLPLHSSRR